MRGFSGFMRKVGALALTLTVGFALAPGTLPAQEAGAEKEATAEAQEQPRQIQVKILGMSCPFCAYGAQQKLKKMDGVKELEVQLETGMATLILEEGADVPNERLRKVIDRAGFEVAEIRRNFESEYPDWKRGEKTPRRS